MMTTTLSKKHKTSLLKYLKEHEEPDLVASYLHYLEQTYDVHPTLFPRERKVYASVDDVIDALNAENKLCHETEIKITFGQKDVDEETRKIYICPFTGKVFGDNTHPNPQDAIYDWVSKCKENTERVNGLRVKRFFISEDPEVIKNYIPKSKPREPISKVVFTSGMSGKLFNSREAVVDDFRKYYLKKLSLAEVQGQDKFELDDKLVAFLEEHLVEDQITGFVEMLADFEEFLPFVEQWVNAEE